MVTQFVLACLLGLGLAASTGLNTSLPLLLLATAARFHIAGITLNAKFAWLHGDIAIGVLIVAAALEVIGDKVPAIDHFLDVVGTFLRPAAGALAAASVLTGLDPTTAAITGLIIGAPVALGIHTVKAAARYTSSAATLGCANPLLSLGEDALSVGMSLASIFAPIVVPAVLAMAILLLWMVAKRIRRANRAAAD